MLEKMRQRSGQTIITILFGMIIVVFIINFGPQSSQTIGCGATEEPVVLEVADDDVRMDSWRYAVNGVPTFLGQLVEDMPKTERASLAMDMLIRRELLAQHADKAGFVVSEDLVNKKIAAGEWLFLGFPQDKGWYFPGAFCRPPAKDAPEGVKWKEVRSEQQCMMSGGTWYEGDFSPDALENLASRLGLTGLDSFVEQQRREWMAEMARSMLANSVNVSREEVLADFQHEMTKATVEFVKFRVPTYQAKVVVDDAKVKEYLAGHGAEVKKKYDAEAATYKQTKPAVRVRQIVIDKPAATAEAPAGKPDPARAEADKVHAQLVAGGDFAALAREHSDDTTTAKLGGDLGWRRLDRPGLPDKKLSDALAALPTDASKPSPVIETARGYYILRVDARREGDLTFDQVKEELAAGMAREFFAREAARKDAEEALAQVKAGKKLEELFERAAEAPMGLPPGIDLEQLRKQLGIPEGVDVEEYLRSKMGGGMETGAMIIEGDAVPASWQPAPAKPAATKPAAQPAPAKPAATKPPAQPAPAKPAATKPPAQPAPAKPAATKPAAATRPAAQPAPAKPAAGDDKPAAGDDKPADPTRPKLQKSGPFTRHPSAVPGIGEAPELVTAIFDELEEGKVADKVYETADGFVIVSLADRSGPEDYDFSKLEEDRRQDALSRKATEVLGGWLRQRCQAVVEGGDLSYDKSLLTTQDEQGNEIPPAYKPCQYM